METHARYRLWLVHSMCFAMVATSAGAAESTMPSPHAVEKQITSKPCGHILTNAGVWSRDGKWIVYDTRSDSAGDVFDGTTIEMVHVESGETRVIYKSHNGACCGVATFHPREDKVIFLQGPEHPTADWQYGPAHRQGLIADLANPSNVRPLDARDLAAPFSPGALRGGTHLHLFSDDGGWVASTYEDHILTHLDQSENSPPHEPNQRNVAVSVANSPVIVPKTHPRNRDGEYFTVLVTDTVRSPRPGSQEVSRAAEEAWVGTRGYRRLDGSWQRRAIAFQGEVVTKEGEMIREVFIVDLPDNLVQRNDWQLAGTATTKPKPPRGARQRRLTFTANRRYPGIQGPRHWLRSSPNGERIAFLMRDATGVVQLWSISPRGGEPLQITHDTWDVASAFTWSPDGRRIAYHADGSVFTVNASSGASCRLTPARLDRSAPRPECCAFSPNGMSIAYVRSITANGHARNQIFCIQLQE